MQITTCWIKSNFERFNKEYFGGELPLPKFSVGNARTRLGAMSYKYRLKNGVRTYYDHAIRMTNYYDIPECEFLNVLLHEMIHYYIAVRHIKDTASHGAVFCRMMSQLNAKGWNIRVRTDTRNWQPAARNTGKDKVFIVLAIQTASDEYILSVVCPSYVSYINSLVRSTDDVKSYAWYTSRDRYFSTYQRVRTPRGRLVSKETFKDKTSSMTPLETIKKEY